MTGFVRLHATEYGNLWRGVLLAVVLGGAFVSSGSADAQTEASAQYARNAVDADLVLTLPASLPSGLSSGVGAGYLRRVGGSSTFAWGARASWSTATEYSKTDSVRNGEIRMRICGLVQHVAGRGSFGLRLGLGATAMYEGRTRAQGSRLGLSGDALETTAWYFFPAADLDVVVFLRVWGAFGMALSGGPTLHLIDGSGRVGWSSALGVSWQP
jgi:hypothetical protein